VERPALLQQASLLMVLARACHVGCPVQPPNTPVLPLHTHCYSHTHRHTAAWPHHTTPCCRAEAAAAEQQLASNQRAAADAQALLNEVHAELSSCR
jgi:hypothetical protein